MTLRPALLALLLWTGAPLVAATTGTAASSSSSPDPYLVEEFTLAELQGHPPDRLERALRTTGLIAVSTSSSTHTRDTVLDGTMCSCWKTLAAEPSENVQSVLLPDGHTQRITLGTATIGESPLPLPVEQLTEACGTDAVQALDDLRDEVASVSHAFVQALDELLLASTSSSSSQRHVVAQPALLRNSYGTTYPTVQSIVQASRHLEHFHLYSKAADATTAATARSIDVLRQEPASLPLHTDAGLFLAFVPGQSCSSNSNSRQLAQEEDASSSFWVQDEWGVTRPAVFPQGSIAVMLGAGAEHWLQLPHHTDRPVALRATRHAVHMAAGQERAWYGMMHLVPENAIIEQEPVQRTFAEMRQELALLSSSSRQPQDDDDDDDAMSIGCGIGAADAPAKRHDDDLLVPSRPRRRRLQHVNGPEVCNNSTNFFCWMSCLDIPQASQAASYIQEGYSLYCLDPSVLASSGNRVSQAIKPCMEAGEVGRAMNPICMGSWQPTAPGNVPSQHVVVRDADGADIEDPFCYGGTSMYMDGFQFLGTTCAIYLFPGWVLTSAGKLVLACLGSIVFGALLEYVIYQRRQMMLKTAPGTRRLVWSAIYYGVQLSMGYCVMLVVMIYSVPLFVSIIAGLVLGHVLFNAKDCLIRSSSSSSTGAAKTAATTASAGAATNVMVGSSKKGLSSGHVDDASHVALTRTVHTSESSDFNSCREDKVNNVVGEGGGNGSTGNDGGGCCSSTGNDNNTSNNNNDDDDEAGVPEGSTPCCQYDA